MKSVRNEGKKDSDSTSVSSVDHRIYAHHTRPCLQIWPRPGLQLTASHSSSLRVTNAHFLLFELLSCLHRTSFSLSLTHFSRVSQKAISSGGFVSICVRAEDSRKVQLVVSHTRVERHLETRWRPRTLKSKPQWPRRSIQNRKTPKYRVLRCCQPSSHCPLHHQLFPRQRSESSMRHETNDAPSTRRLCLHLQQAFCPRLLRQNRRVRDCNGPCPHSLNALLWVMFQA